MSDVTDLMAVLCIPRMVRSASMGDFNAARKLKDLTGPHMMKVKTLPIFLRQAAEHQRNLSQTVEAIPVSPKLVLESQCRCRKQHSVGGMNLSSHTSFHPPSQKQTPVKAFALPPDLTSDQDWARLRSQARSLVFSLKRPSPPALVPLYLDREDVYPVLSELLTEGHMSKRGVEWYFQYLELWERRKNAFSGRYRIFPVDFSLKILIEGKNADRLKAKPISFIAEKWLFPLFTTHWLLLVADFTELSLLVFDPLTENSDFGAVFDPFLRFLQSESKQLTGKQGAGKWALSSSQWPKSEVEGEDGLAVCEEARAIIMRQRSTRTTGLLQESIAEDLALYGLLRKAKLA